MRAEIISISSVSRSSTPAWRAEAIQEGFAKALGALQALKGCNVRETVVALENWEAAGLLSKTEVDALIEFHGWRRGE